jgi:dCMP deaminase
MALAEAAALRSEDPFFAVGAVVLDARRAVRGVGYNGTFSGVAIDWDDRDLRREYVIHAEQNALRYVTPDTAAGGTLAVTHLPCSVCMRMLASYGIARVLWRHPLDPTRYPLSAIEDIALKTGIVINRV